MAEHFQKIKVTRFFPRLLVSPGPCASRGRSSSDPGWAPLGTEASHLVGTDDEKSKFGKKRFRICARIEMLTFLRSIRLRLDLRLQVLLLLGFQVVILVILIL